MGDVTGQPPPADVQHFLMPYQLQSKIWEQAFLCQKWHGTLAMNHDIIYTVNSR